MTSPDNTVSKHMSFADSDIWPTKCMVIYPNSEETPAANDLIISYPNYIYYISLSLAFKPINSDARIRKPPRFAGSRVGRHISPTPCCSVNAFALELILVLGRIPTKNAMNLCWCCLQKCANSGKLTITMGNHQLIQKIEDTSEQYVFFIVFRFSRIKSMIFSSTFHLHSAKLT